MKVGIGGNIAAIPAFDLRYREVHCKQQIELIFGELNLKALPERGTKDFPCG
jgi:hypothetical protein